MEDSAIVLAIRASAPEVSNNQVLCDICASINISRLQSEGELSHLPNVWDLPQSARNCSLCTMILHTSIESAGRPVSETSDLSSDFAYALRTLDRSAYRKGMGVREDDKFPILIKGKSGRIHFQLWSGHWDKSPSGWPPEAYRPGRYEDIDLGVSLHVFCLEGINKQMRVSGGAKQEEPIPGGVPIHTASNLHHLANLVENWVELCRSHEQCQNERSKDPPMPTRVLDVGTSGSPSLRLIHTNRRPGRYVALSHCWGGSQPLKTTKATLEAHCREIPLQEVPATFTDAIAVTRSIGVQYLWIDSLAIIQDDPDDWKREAEMMGDVYAYAYITIAAARARNSTAGFLGPRTPTTYVRITPTNHDSRGHASPGPSFYIGPVHDFEADINKGSLISRSWCLQERVLSPRMLHFTDTQVYWECWSRCEGEDLQHSNSYRCAKSAQYPACLQLNQEEANAAEPPDQTPTQWWLLLDNYNATQLTYQSDKVAAVSGLVNKIKDYTKISYVAGLWEDQFHRGLLWSRLATPLENIPELGLPSWSWAGRKGPTAHLSLNRHVTGNIALVEQPDGGGFVLHAEARTMGPYVRFGDMKLKEKSAGFIERKKEPKESTKLRERNMRMLDTWINHSVQHRLIYAPGQYSETIVSWATLDEDDGGTVDWASIKWVLVAYRFGVSPNISLDEDEDDEWEDEEEDEEAEDEEDEEEDAAKPKLIWDGKRGDSNVDVYSANKPGISRGPYYHILVRKDQKKGAYTRIGLASLETLDWLLADTEEIMIA